MQLLKKFAVTILGAVLLLAGLAMMVLPGPGIVVIVAGLAVLATEYVWARSLLDRARTQAAKAQEAAVANRWRTGATVLFGLGMIGLGVAMLVLDLDVPFWGGVTGAVLIVTALILLTTTYLTLRASHGEDTTHTRDQFSRSGPGATRADIR
jgi:protein-S-isoprenylcysteine O-methyltransferase Ste14